MKVTFESGAIALEGDVVAPAGCARAAVICHPHPQYGGDMSNGVVCTVADTLNDAGYATLRFNFRGVGASSGRYDGGAGEADDAGAAVRFLATRVGSGRVTLAGYSFGAMIALRAGVPMGEVDALIAVSPPLAFSDMAFVAACTKPKLFIVGDRDQFCDHAELESRVAAMAEPKTLRVLKGADHFLFGQERMIAASVREWTQARNAPPSRS